jgi:CMP-N,N'-diacetyllegionaminic acid synthase
VIGGRAALALIPARGGSKGLPRKNVLAVKGRPLLCWTVAAARAAQSLDRVVVSSDDEEIIATARACGCEVPFRRPAPLASDAAAMIDVVLHALDELPQYEVVVLLQPTSPLRTAHDIEAACRVFVDSAAPACVSVSPVAKSPYWMYRLSGQQRLQPILEGADDLVRRQDLPPVYVLNGALYIADAAWLRKSRTFLSQDTVAYVMPANRSLDIDTPADFAAFERAAAESNDA